MHHPDKPGGSHDRMVEVNRACHVLRNNDLKAVYDSKKDVVSYELDSFNELLLMYAGGGVIAGALLSQMSALM